MKKKRYLDENGTMFLISLFSVAMDEKDAKINALQSELDELKEHAIIDSSMLQDDNE